MTITNKMAALILIIHGVVTVLCATIVSAAEQPNNHSVDNDNETVLDIQINKTGAYNVTVSNATWLTSAPTFLRYDNRTASTKNGTLTLNDISVRSGEDEIGRFRETSMVFLVSSARLRFYAFVKVYRNIPLVLFTQYFPDGANWTQAPSVNSVFSGFPGFQVRQTDVELGCLSFGGEYLGDQEKRIVLFNKSSSVNDGISGGPLAIFDQAGRTVILSPFDNFMASSFWQDSISGGNLYSGVMGGVSHIPPQYRQTFIAFYGPSINKAFDGWGNIIRAYYKKTPEQQEKDPTLNYLGYWTSRGMHYFFHTEENKTYEETVLHIRNSDIKMKIPFSYFQYGPWWYYRDTEDGVKTWEARPDVFPDGFSVLNRNLGLPSVATAGFWSNETTYAKQNGGKYDFILQNRLSLPIDQKFWTELFQNATGWGLKTYQQVGVADVLSPTSWKVGITSLFAKSLGLAPACGPFLTYNKSDDTSGSPMVRSLISTLSTGPVGFGDEIGETNKTVLMKCCNADGLILKPDYPAVALDKQIVKAAFPATDGPEGEAWVSYSDISGLRFANLLVLGVKEGTRFSISQKDTGFFDHADDNDLYAIPYDNPLGWGVFTTFGPLTFTDACSVENFCLYHLATSIPNWFMTVIFGEMNKWVPMSPKRVLSISWTNETVTVPLRGAANETFDFWYILGSKVDMVTCMLSLNGSAIFKMDNNLGIVTCG